MFGNIFDLILCYIFSTSGDHKSCPSHAKTLIGAFPGIPIGEPRAGETVGLQQIQSTKPALVRTHRHFVEQSEKMTT